MYSYIRGELAEINSDHIVLDVNGIGYQIYIPTNSLNYLPSIGEMVKIHTYLYIREDAMMLYGFLTRDDLDMFKMLITVSGIGPKGGLGILSTLSTDDLRFAVLSDDAKAIAKAPGVGAKTAQRLILELKDKLSLEDAFEQKFEKTGGPAESHASGTKNEAVQALVALGYSSSEALRALNGIEITEETDVEEILKMALKNMAFL